MKKIFLISVLLILCLICGCKNSNDNFKTEIDAAIKTALSEEIPSVEENNCNKTYYSYNADMNIGRGQSDEISNQFIINGNETALALDISAIALDAISDSTGNTLRDIGSLTNTVYTHKGRYYNSQNQIRVYQLSISKVEDSAYFVLIQTSEFIFVADISSGSCANTVHDMLVLLRSCSVNSTDLLLDYVSDTIVTTSPSVITLFKDIIPESGYIIDYQDQWKEDSSFIKIDLSDENEKNNVEGEDYSETMDDITQDVQEGENE